MERFPLLELRRGADVRSSNVDKKSSDDDPKVRLVSYVDVYYNDVIVPELELMAATATPEQIEKFGLRVGDVVITKDSETAEDIGVAAFVETVAPDMVCGYHLAIIRSRGVFDPKFLYYAFRSDFVRGQMTARANGVTRYGLTYDAIRSLSIPAPSLEQQKAVAAFLDEQLALVRELVPLSTGVGSDARGVVQELASHVQEYEACLVSEAVIGDYPVAVEELMVR